MVKDADAPRKAAADAANRPVLGGEVQALVAGIPILALLVAWSWRRRRRAH